MNKFTFFKSRQYDKLSDEQKDTVTAEQLRILMLEMKVNGLSVSLLILGACLALWGHISNFLLIGFIVLYILEGCWKIPMGARFEKELKAGNLDVEKWYRLSFISAGYTSVVYGLASLVMFMPLPFPNLIAVICAYGGLVFMCFSIAVDMPRNSSLLAVLLVLPVIVALLFSGNTMLVLSGLLFAMMTAVVVNFSRSTADRLISLIVFKDENNRLLEQLQREKLTAEDSKQLAEQAVIDKSKFIAGASHDLRQPLHALGLYQVALRKRCYNEDNAHLIDSIEQSTEALSQMFNGLLDVSRLDAGVIDPAPQNFSMSGLLSTLEREYSQQAKAKGIDLTFDVGTIEIYSDPVLVERVVRNLLSNAVKFTVNGQIDIKSKVIGDAIELMIIDTGRGISDEQESRVFDEFHQVNEDGHSNDTGFGLGLSIVKQICLLLEVPLCMQSTHGVGTCFTLKFEAAKEKINPNLRPVQPPVIPNGKQILIIDDESEILNSMRLALESWGYYCVSTDNAEYAIDQVENGLWSPSVVICDYQLQGELNGIEVVSILKDTLTTSSEILIITGDTRPETLSAIHKKGFALLQKPVQPKELRQHLEGKSTHRTLASLESPA